MMLPWWRAFRCKAIDLKLASAEAMRVLSDF
jgi:hypothetical protein